MQFALKYFQDVVAKGAYEMLPGCATVVLETVLAIQAFAGSLSSPPEQEVVSGLQAAYKAVAALTAWADTVILGESDWRPGGEGGGACALCSDCPRQLYRCQGRSRGAWQGLLTA